MTEFDPKLMAICGVTKEELEGREVCKPVGCNRCGGSGYKGRRGVYEFMKMSAEIRELAFNRAPLAKIRAAAKNAGMRDLRGDAVLKVLEGKTTLEEVARIAQVEGVVEVNEEDDELVA